MWSIAALLVACGGDGDPPVCDDAGLPSACESAPVPTYEELYRDVLRPTCGRDGPSCHGEGSRMTLSFVDEAASRDALLERYVTPGSLACSELFRRVTSDDPLFRMPPAEPLPEAARCAIARWIEASTP
ncbi:Hypothetical protein I5071_55430 [Sandaracinus amylolyticus]|nr:Hypothetical protein I5071_55430 [Sandaracinus amylolyticus]